MRSPLRLLLSALSAAIVIASGLYGLTQNSNEQPVRPGDYNVTLTFRGYARSYDLHVPPQYDGKTPLPLVIALHPYGGDTASFANITGFNKEADARVFWSSILMD